MFHRTTVCTTPAWTYALFMFGSDKPITDTSVRPVWRTASAAPGTAGAAIAMISFTDGYTFSTVCVSANALSRSSSLGRTVDELQVRILRAQPLADVDHPLVLVGGAQRAGDDRELAFAAGSRAASSVSV